MLQSPFGQLGGALTDVLKSFPQRASAKRIVVKFIIRVATQSFANIARVFMFSFLSVCNWQFGANPDLQDSEFDPSAQIYLIDSWLPSGRKTERDCPGCIHRGQLSRLAAAIFETYCDLIASFAIWEGALDERVYEGLIPEIRGNTPSVFAETW